MSYLASYLVELKEQGVKAELRYMLSRGDFGNVFEIQLHKTLFEQFKTGAHFELKRLYPVDYIRKAGDTVEDIINVHAERKAFIGTIEDIGHLKDFEYGMPTISNFPFVDIVVKPNLEIQFIIGKKHGRSKHFHSEIERQMGGQSKDHILVFACDKENFDTFMYVEGLVLEVKQYKMLVQWRAKHKRPHDALNND